MGISRRLPSPPPDAVGSGPGDGAADSRHKAHRSGGCRGNRRYPEFADETGLQTLARSTGSWVPRTKAAIKKFQVATGLPGDGKVSPALSSTLRRELKARVEKAESRTDEPGARVVKVASAKPGVPDVQGRPETGHAKKPVDDLVPGKGSPAIIKPRHRRAGNQPAPPQCRRAILRGRRQLHILQRD